MLRHCNTKLLVRLDQSQHCVFVRRRVISVDIALYTSICRSSTVCELFDKVIAEKLGAWGRLNCLQKKPCGCLCFFDPRCKLIRRREASSAVTRTTEVGLLLLLLLIKRRSI